jgi:membrane-bound inhibitor of C-type lysozyme
MMFRFFPPLALLALAAQPLVARPHYSPSTGQSSLYACADGRTIEVLYSGGDAAVITLGDDTVQLARAVAASGERYVGGGWQWWGKGRRDGMLSPIAADETTASAPGVNCHVR